MALYVVRHATAGNRDTWEGDDRLRPLTRSGLGQAEGIRQQLAHVSIGLIISSPYMRCIQTVEPLARERGLRIEQTEGLAEGAGIEPTLALVKKLQGQNAVLCTHGDVVQELVEQLVEQGIIQPFEAQSLEMGSTWVMEEQGGHVTRAGHIPAPES